MWAHIALTLLLIASATPELHYSIDITMNCDKPNWSSSLFIHMVRDDALLEVAYREHEVSSLPQRSRTVRGVDNRTDIPSNWITLKGLLVITHNCSFEENRFEHYLLFDRRSFYPQTWPSSIFVDLNKNTELN